MYINITYALATCPKMSVALLSTMALCAQNSRLGVNTPPLTFVQVTTLHNTDVLTTSIHTLRTCGATQEPRQAHWLVATS